MPRPQKKHHYIYKTTCLVTGKFYVGMHSTDNIDDGYLGSGKILNYSRKKHGDQNHKKEIIEMLPTREALKLREKEIVNEKLLADPLNMNLKYGGEGGGRFRDAQHQLNCASAGGRVSGRKNGAKAIWIARNHRTGNTKRFASNGMLSKHHSDVTKSSMSLAHLGEKNSQFGTRWVCNQHGAIKVKKSEVHAYIAKGYQLGRKNNAAVAKLGDAQP